MRAFQLTPGGFYSILDSDEREILVRLVEDVIALICGDEDHEPGIPPPVPHDPIAHLDFEPSKFEDDDGDRAVEHDDFMDPALARIFPPMSLADPVLAKEMRSLTFTDLRREKLANLRALATSLAIGDRVTVPTRAVEPWLSAITDVRLVLASRLGIESDKDAERVYDLAVSSASGERPATSEDDEFEAALASLYSGISWWQESLLAAVSGRQRPH